MLAHGSFNYTEDIAKCQTLRFIEAHPNSLDRSCLLGHLTGSAGLVTPDRRSTVLVHRKKLNRWLQPGGHADGNGNLFEVALHEAFEETGLDLPIFTPVNSLIFDIDVQKIPNAALNQRTCITISGIFSNSLTLIYLATTDHMRPYLFQLKKSKNSIIPLLLKGWR